MRGQQVARALKAEHQSLKTLQQRIVQFPRDARPLVDAFLQAQIEIVRDLPHTEPIQRPNKDQDRDGRPRHGTTRSDSRPARSRSR